jgi:glutamate carboxypeptidase
MDEVVAAGQAIMHHLEPLIPTYLEELRQLCAIECPTGFKVGVDEAGEWVRAWAARRDWQVRTWADPEVGDSLVITVPGGATDGPFVLLVAHLDTVYPVGIAAERPMRVEGDVVLGPGTCDNKSGLLSALYAMAALQDLELLAPLGAVSLVCGGDEETDMRSSAALLTEMAPAYDLALVLEAGRENGDIVGARKGSGTFFLEVQGHAAHAGVEPHRGANAILALSQQIVALQTLNGMRPGTTINVGVTAGGTFSNVVPDRAGAEIDVRVTLPEDMGPVEAALRRIADTPYVPGASGTLGGGWRSMPMARTPQIAALADLAAVCALELGFAVEAAATGGVSYANRLAGLGLPVLDGLGPVGGLDHSPEEYILLSSIVPRTALLALLILRRAEGM